MGSVQGVTLHARTCQIKLFMAPTSQTSFHRQLTLHGVRVRSNFLTPSEQFQGICPFHVKGIAIALPSLNCAHQRYDDSAIAQFEGLSRPITRALPGRNRRATWKDREHLGKSASTFCWVVL